MNEYNTCIPNKSALESDSLEQDITTAAKLADNFGYYDLSVGHDTIDPDHVEAENLFNVSPDVKIIRHRKIYVTKRPFEFPAIQSIELTIPIDFDNNYQSVYDLPSPKPIYKMRKYTTYKVEPQIQTFPITSTILKPVGFGNGQQTILA